MGFSRVRNHGVRADPNPNPNPDRNPNPNPNLVVLVQQSEVHEGGAGAAVALQLLLDPPDRVVPVQPDLKHPHFEVGVRAMQQHLRV